MQLLYTKTEDDDWRVGNKTLRGCAELGVGVLPPFLSPPRQWHIFQRVARRDFEILVAVLASGVKKMWQITSKNSVT